MPNVRLANAAQQAAMNAVVDLIDAGSGAGTIKYYTGTQPVNANTALSSNTLLATLTFSDPAFGATGTDGVATASAITDDSGADATGTVTWARIEDSDGNTICDVDVGTSGATVIVPTTSITSGEVVALSSFTFTHPDGT
jgi:hypothetical protein